MKVIEIAVTKYVILYCIEHLYFYRSSTENCI